MRSSTMLRYITLRLTLPAVLSVTLLPAAAFAQPKYPQPVREPPGKAHAKKKKTKKPQKGTTDETVNKKRGEVQGPPGNHPKTPVPQGPPPHPATAAAPGTP